MALRQASMVSGIQRVMCVTPTPRGPQVSNIVSDATFILLVEKDAAFMRLAEDRFYNSYPCIIVTAKGQPDVATRCGPYCAPHAAASQPCMAVCMLAWLQRQGWAE